MIRQASHDLHIDPARSYVVGDRWLDVELAHNVGASGVLVRTGYGASEERQAPDGARAEFVADNLIEAVSWILRTAKGERGTAPRTD